MHMNAKRSFILTVVVSSFFYLCLSLACIIIAESLLAKGNQAELREYAMTFIAAYMTILVCSRVAITRCLEDGSVIYMKHLPERMRVETVEFVSRACGMFTWIPMCLYLVITILGEESLDSIAERRRPYVYVCAFLAVLDPIHQLTPASGKPTYIHHFVMAVLTLLMIEWDRTFQPGFVIMAIQNALDRCVWPLIFISRMAHLKSKAIAENAAEEMRVKDEDVCNVESPLSPPVDKTTAVIELPRGAVTFGVVDELFPDTTEVLRTHFSVALVFYLGVRVLVDVLELVYLLRYWHEIDRHWQVLLIAACLLYNVLDWWVYVVMYRRSSFCPTKKDGKETVYGPPTTGCNEGDRGLHLSGAAVGSTAVLGGTTAISASTDSQNNCSTETNEPFSTD